MENITVTAPKALPAGTYPATFAGLQRKTSREGSPFWRWEFTITTADGPLAVSGASSDRTGPKSKAYRWLTALLGGRRPEPGEQLGANLVGRHCVLVLSQDEQGYNDVDDVLPRQLGGEHAIAGAEQRVADKQAATEVANRENEPQSLAPPPAEAPAEEYGELPF